MKENSNCKICEVLVPHGEEYCQRCGMKVQLDKATQEIARLREMTQKQDRIINELRARL